MTNNKIAQISNGMDKFLLQAFQSLPDSKVPSELHAAVFRAAAFRRSWKYVSALTFAIAFAFSFSLWHLYTRIIDIQLLSSLKAITATFELSWVSFMDTVGMLADTLPLHSIIIVLLNFVALIFMMFVLRSFMRLQSQFQAR